MHLAEPCYIRVLRVLAEIRDGIVDLAGSYSAGQIKEVLDLDQITQEINAKSFDWATCKAKMLATLDIIKRVQVRHSAICT